MCGLGDPIAVLNACQRRRRGQMCVCRVSVTEVTEDLATAGCPEVAEALDADLEPEDVLAFADAVEACRRRAESDPSDVPRVEAADRLGEFGQRLALLVDREVALSDRHAEDIDP